MHNKVQMATVQMQELSIQFSSTVAWIWAFWAGGFWRAIRVYHPCPIRCKAAWGLAWKTLVLKLTVLTN